MCCGTLLRCWNVLFRQLNVWGFGRYSRIFSGERWPVDCDIGLGSEEVAVGEVDGGFFPVQHGETYGRHVPQPFRCPCGCGQNLFVRDSVCPHCEPDTSHFSRTAFRERAQAQKHMASRAFPANLEKPALTAAQIVVIDGPSLFLGDGEWRCGFCSHVLAASGRRCHLESYCRASGQGLTRVYGTQEAIGRTNVTIEGSSFYSAIFCR